MFSCVQQNPHAGPGPGDGPEQQQQQQQQEEQQQGERRTLTPRDGGAPGVAESALSPPSRTGEFRKVVCLLLSSITEEGGGWGVWTVICRYVCS
jgi:hypothetical protein